MTASPTLHDPYNGTITPRFSPVSMRHSNRRQFILGRSALDAMEDLADQLAPADSSGDGPSRNLRRRPASNFLLQLSRQAMACEFTIYLNAAAQATALQAAMRALDRIDQLEEQLTIYRDTSEVSRMNQTAALRPVEVDAGLFQLLARCQQLHAETEGAFDITSGPLSKAWGFFRRQGRVPIVEELRSALDAVGSEYLQLCHSTQTVAYTRPGVEVNLGAIGKGYALDQCAELLATDGVEDFVIHGGRSSVLAHGNREGTVTGGWQVEVRHPQRPAVQLAHVTIRNSAIGTSGTAMQYFHVGRQRYGHILDPRTGYPADGLLSVTVVAPDAATADALATAFFVLGTDATHAYCEAHPSIGAITIAPGERAGDICIEVINLDADTVQLQTV